MVSHLASGGIDPSALSVLRDLTIGQLLDAVARPAAAAPEPDRYVDLKSSGLYRPALRAIASGELRAFQVPGTRKLHVLASDFHAWIEREDHRVVKATNDVVADEPDEIAELIASNEKRRRPRRAETNDRAVG